MILIGQASGSDNENGFSCAGYLEGPGGKDFGPRERRGAQADPRLGFVDRN
jgi:hypothetical protein